jgi:hypothetical protein
MRTEAFCPPQIIVYVQGSSQVPVENVAVGTAEISIAACSYSELLMPKLYNNAMDEKRIAIHAFFTASYHELGGFEARFRLLQQAAHQIRRRSFLL